MLSLQVPLSEKITQHIILHSLFILPSSRRKGMLMEYSKCWCLSSTMQLGGGIRFWLRSAVWIICVPLALPVYAVGTLTKIPSHYDSVGPLKLKYAWKFFQYEGSDERIANLTSSGQYVAGATFPLDVQVDPWKQRIFVTTPRLIPGISATLNTVPKEGPIDPKLRPYPSWNYHLLPVRRCNETLVSVFKIMMDPSRRLLYVLDTGYANNANVRPNRICLPKLVVFNITSDEIVLSSEFPRNLVPCNALPNALEVEALANGSRFVYVGDSYANAITVGHVTPEYSVRWWRWASQWFYATPSRGIATIAGVSFKLMDGIFDLALGQRQNKSTLFISVFASGRLCAITTEFLRQNAQGGDLDTIMDVRLPGGYDGPGGILETDVNGTRMFFPQVETCELRCWRTEKPTFSEENFQTVVRDEQRLQFIVGLKMEHNASRMWLFSTRFQLYANRLLNNSEVNYRLFYFNTSGYIC